MRIKTPNIPPEVHAVAVELGCISFGSIRLQNPKQEEKRAGSNPTCAMTGQV
jgi:hypothetical protein